MNFPKKNTQQYRILRMLSTGAKVNGIDFVTQELITRGASRVKELISKGWSIEVIRNGYKKNKYGENIKIFDSYRINNPYQLQEIRKEIDTLF